MRVRIFTAALGAVACLLVANASQAQCTIDNECPDQLICENGVCSAPRPSLAVPPAESPPQRAAVAPTSTTTDPHANRALETPDDERREKRRKKGPRHSTAMLVGGIVMTSFAPISLLLGAAGMMTGRPALFIGGFAGAGVLAGVGIPLIVIGGRRKPLTTARLTPWLTPQSTGLGLSFEL